MDSPDPGTNARQAAALQPPEAFLQTCFAQSLKLSLGCDFTHPWRIPRERWPCLTVGVLLSWPLHPILTSHLTGREHTSEQGWQHPCTGFSTCSNITSCGCGSWLEHLSTKIMQSAGFSEAGKQQTQRRYSSKVAEVQDCLSWLTHKASFKLRRRPRKCLCLSDWNFCEGQSPAASEGLLWQLPWAVLGVPQGACSPFLQSPHEGKVLPPLLR